MALTISHPPELSYILSVSVFLCVIVHIYKWDDNLHEYYGYTFIKYRLSLIYGYRRLWGYIYVYVHIRGFQNRFEWQKFWKLWSFGHNITLNLSLIKCVHGAIPRVTIWQYFPWDYISSLLIRWNFLLLFIFFNSSHSEWQK